MRMFVVPAVVSVVTLAAALVFAGPSWAFGLFTLAVLEVTLSFDNAVINSLFLGRMSPRWQQLFLTVGILIAVFGMRLVFPVVVVAIAGHVSMGETIDMALHDSHRYAEVLEGAHHAIATFGATFLGMIFLDWLLDEREITWLGPVERLAAKFGALDHLAVVAMLGILIVAARDSLLAGVLALITYLAVNGFSGYLESRAEAAESISGPGPATITPLVQGGLGTFMYLELMDASFSFDGVLAAFAITNDVVMIALGLGVGAFYIRTMTVYLVRRGVLGDLIHLEHGAHYAIGALSALLFVSLFRELPEAVTACVSLGLIGAAAMTSVAANRQVAV